MWFCICDYRMVWKWNAWVNSVKYPRYTNGFHQARYDLINWNRIWRSQRPWDHKSFLLPGGCGQRNFWRRIYSNSRLVVVLKVQVPASPGNKLEIQSPGPTPILQNQKIRVGAQQSVFYQALQGFWCAQRFQKHWTWVVARSKQKPVFRSPGRQMAHLAGETSGAGEFRKKELCFGGLCLKQWESVQNRTPAPEKNRGMIEVAPQYHRGWELCELGCTGHQKWEMQDPYEKWRPQQPSVWNSQKPSYQNWNSRSRPEKHVEWLNVWDVSIWAGLSKSLVS